MSPILIYIFQKLRLTEPRPGPTPIQFGRVYRATTLALATGAGHAQAGNWPNKPIRYIVPFAPGGTTDFLACMFGEKLAIALGQPIVIENKPGQGGSVGVAELATHAKFAAYRQAV